MEARKEWELTVFEDAGVDNEAIRSYLEQLCMSDKETAAAFKDLRGDVEDFERGLEGYTHFNTSTLRWVISGLSVSDLLSNEKCAALRDFLNNEVILNELCDVLNMRMAALDRWTWGDFVALEQRRKINGGW